jgi:hypothetical protein
LYLGLLSAQAFQPKVCTHSTNETSAGNSYGRNTIFIVWSLNIPGAMSINKGLELQNIISNFKDNLEGRSRL